jgi:hypothetical protein
MSIGMGPTVVVDWEADSGNKLTLPIGLGITKTIRLGNVPVKLRFESQYSVIRPDNFGTAWNFRLQISPVIPSPFKCKEQSFNGVAGASPFVCFRIISIFILL